MASSNELLCDDMERSIDLEGTDHGEPWVQEIWVERVMVASVLTEIALMILKIVLVVCVTNEPFQALLLANCYML